VDSFRDEKEQEVINCCDANFLTANISSNSTLHGTLCYMIRAPNSREPINDAINIYPSPCIYVF